jgi:TolB-like protein/Tfp pilus assembly protein PilF
VLRNSITAMIYSSAHFSVDTSAFRLERDGKSCALEPQVFDLIVYLIEHRDRVVTRDELLDNLWQGRIVSESAINARIKLARKALGDDGKQQRFIKTIHRRGYQFVGEINGASQAAAQPAVVPAWPSLDKPSIVVLPFENPDAASTGSSLSDGLTQILIANLSCYRELLVIDQESAFAFRQGDDDASLASRLDVEYVVKGSIRQSGTRLRIAVQLLEIASGKTLWVQRLDREIEDIFDLEDEVATRIAINLVGQIDDESRSRARCKRPENLTAFDYVVRARPLVFSTEANENTAVREQLLQAIAQDPNYATAYACLALNHCAVYESAWCDSPAEVLQQAHDYAQQAVALDNFNSLAHIAMGSVQMYRRNFEISEIHFDQAIDCNPNAYDAFCLKSWLLAYAGRAEEVEVCGATALRLNPLAPDACLMAMITAQYSQRNYSNALDTIARIQDPYDDSEALRAACLAQLGRDQEARAVAGQLIESGAELIFQPDWLRRWPFSHARDLEHFLDGLYKAGVMQPPSSRSEQPSIAVLQFRNLSRDPEQAYFSEGMAANICSCLSRIRSLLVKPGFSYDSANIPGIQIASDLEVGYLLGGSVQRDGARVRVSVELIDGETGAIKWSEHFDRSGDSIIDIQDDIAGAVTGTLWSYGGTLLEAEQERLAHKPTRDFNAFDNILRGIYYKDKYSREATRLAHQCFDRAIELDPLGAEAYGWSAWEHIMDIAMRWTDDDSISLQQAYAAARKAIANDPHNEMGHWALAEALILDEDYERAFHEYDRAMQINPNNPDLLATRGMQEAVYGRFDIGIDMIRRAIERNRHHPEWYFWSLGIACFAAGRLAEAIDAFQRMSEHNTDSLGYLVASLAHDGRLAEARSRLAELRRMDPGFSLDSVIEALSFLRDDARKSLLDGLQLALGGDQPRLKSVL